MDGLIYVYMPPPSHSRTTVSKNARRPLRQPLDTANVGVRPSFSGSESSDLTPVSPQRHQDKSNAGTSGMATLDTKTDSPSSASLSLRDSNDILVKPYELRHGRRYLRDMAYPLPCDLAEIQRQNLRTLLGVTVFDTAVCAPEVAKTVPKKVLEVGCGSAYWSSTCHDFFVSLGHPNVSFTGIDIAPVSSDLKKQGIDWRFVQHDLRRMPWPFEDEEFDLVMVKDMSMVMALGTTSQQFLDENMRVLNQGGTLEIWESDEILRCLLPHPPPQAGQTPKEEEAANATQTFRIMPGMPFAPAQNKFIQDSNLWIEEALDKRRLPINPCTQITQMLHEEAETLCNVGFRRIAIPLSELHWEKDKPLPKRKPSRAGFGSRNISFKGKAKIIDTCLTPDQAALREMALLIVLQKIESLEPVLREVSGKNSEEWANWWGSMMSNLLEQEGAAGGECLEIGAWWATKRSE